MNQERKAREAGKAANRQVFTRTVILMLVFGLVIFIPLFYQLYQIQIVQHDELEQKAIEQQTSEYSISASRGTIYDASGNTLAISSTVYDVIISPKAILEKQQELDKAKEDALNSSNEERRAKASDYDWNVEDVICTNLAQMLDLEEETIRQRCANTESQYQKLASKVDYDTEQQIRELMESYSLSGCIYLQSNTKRYYPYGDLAAQIIGFTNDNGGAYGLEAAYEEELSGQAGLMVTAKNARGTDLLNFFQDYYDAQDGSDIYLTLDATIQSYCENYLAEICEEYQPRQGGLIIAMECDTGRILGMAQNPTFDLNSYTEITDSGVLEQVGKTAEELVTASETEYQAAYAALEEARRALAEQAEEAEENGEEETAEGEGAEETPSAAAAAVLEDGTTIQTESATYTYEAGVLKDADGEELTVLTYDQAYNQAYSAALSSMWTNKAITSTYEPGSTFKALVLAAGLEEGVISEDSSFYCSGVVQVENWQIHCDNRSGHGGQTLREAIGHSCNPALIEIGQRLGKQTFYQYLRDFGILDTTGVDLPYEGTGLVWPEESFNIVDLATASFGQSLTMTPLQLITAFNATINGGYLYTPHVVDSIVDASGSVTYSASASPVRQVISEATSDTCASILEDVVSKYTGKNAYRAGYRIGGKTGTAEVQPRTKGENIVSFMGFAPADDPDVIVLVVLDRPESDGGNYTTNGTYISGGNLCAPTAGDLLVDILDYRGYEQAYSADDITGALTTMPDLAGLTESQAEEALQGQRLNYRTVGEGETVTGQIPAAGRSVPQNSTVILYMGEEAPTDAAEMPNLLGLTPEEAMSALNARGIFMRASGASGETSSEVYCVAQDIEAGTMVSRGYVVEVRFAVNDTSVDAD